MVSWRGGEQGRGRPGFRLILGNASLCSLELGLHTASGHGDGAAASEDNDGSPQSGRRGKITSAIRSNSSRSWLQMEYEDRSLVLVLLHCGQKRAAPRSVCGHEDRRNVKNAGLCNAGLEVAVRTTFAGTSFISSHHSGPALTAQTEYSDFMQDLPQKSAPTSIPR